MVYFNFDLEHDSDTLNVPWFMKAVIVLNTYYCRGSECGVVGSSHCFEGRDRVAADNDTFALCAKEI